MDTIESEEKIVWSNEARHKRGLDINKELIEMVGRCVEWGLPEPEFEVTETSLVVTLWKSKLNEEYLDTLGLNERQRKAINYMKKHKKIASKEYAELFSITDRTARNDLKSLLDKKILIQRGTSKKLTYYELSV